MRRHRAIEEPNSRDRWMVSYADFITLLFAFFVVLFASIHRNGHSVPEISEAIHFGFQNPAPISSRGSSEASPPRLSAHPAATGGPGVKEASDGADAQSIQPTSTPMDSPSRSSESIQQLQKKLGAAIGKEIQRGEVSIGATPEGLVIRLNEIGFFASGEATLEPGAAEKIRQMAGILAPYSFPLRVEGHSDDRPIHNARFRSNWELSTARAVQVLMLLLHTSHLDPSRLSVAGYGPYRPIASNSTAAGRRLNRRVDLVVVDKAATQRPLR